MRQRWRHAHFVVTLVLACVAAAVWSTHRRLGARIAATALPGRRAGPLPNPPFVLQLPRAAARASTSAPLSIHVVYFCYVLQGADAPRSIALVKTQIAELVDWGLSNASASVHVILTAANRTEESVAHLTALRGFAASVLPPTTAIEMYYANRHEYPGIHRLYTLARSVANPERHVALYFHSKGMVFSRDPSSPAFRTAANEQLTAYTIQPWRAIVRRFQDEPSATRAGMACNPKGFVWFNFFWVRLSYARALAEPTPLDGNERNSRLQYEMWLGRPRDGAPFAPFGWAEASTCFSTCPFNSDYELDVAFMENEAVPDKRYLPSKYWPFNHCWTFGNVTKPMRDVIIRKAISKLASKNGVH